MLSHGSGMHTVKPDGKWRAVSSVRKREGPRCTVVSGWNDLVRRWANNERLPETFVPALPRSVLLPRTACR